MLLNQHNYPKIKFAPREEFDRLSALRRRYEEQLQYFPKGSLSRKIRGNREYLYLAHREGSRVIFEYIGNSDSDEARKVIKDVEERKSVERKLKEVKLELKQLERLLNRF